jgi:hypothetical protein
MPKPDFITLLFLIASPKALVSSPVRVPLYALTRLQTEC